MNVRRARTFFAFLCVAVVALRGLVACGDDDSTRDSADGSFFDASATSDASAVDAGGPVGIANGVVLLHAAAFPAFRVCFENYPELRPQPDTALMPHANSVGVEVGSAVAIAPLERAPGKVYVINQKKVVASRGDTSELPCGRILDQLDLNFEYLVGGEINQPIGVSAVAVLAITGCGNRGYLDLLGIDPSDCSLPWDTQAGSLTARTLTLRPPTTKGVSTVAVQLIHLSSLLERQRGESPLSVTFGSLDASGPLAQKVAEGPALFDASPPVSLSLAQNSEAIYKTHGFRMAFGPTGDAGADGGGFSVDQTLAAVQDLSSPDGVPTSYYVGASNYALLLLGDSRVPRTIDGGPNPAYPLRSVHLIAVPVLERLDAGTEAAAPPHDDATAGDR